MPAKSQLSIDGFRKDRRTVKRFVFGSVDNSQAAKSGQARNVGVVGFAASGVLHLLVAFIVVISIAMVAGTPTLMPTGMPRAALSWPWS